MAPPEKSENERQVIIARKVITRQRVTGAQGPLSSQMGRAGQTPYTPGPRYRFTSPPSPAL